MAKTTRRAQAERPEPPELMTPAEVAALFRVDAKTVTRWAKAGRLQFVMTLGGHRRYLRAHVEALLRGEGR
ncbi:MAG TPA: BldC family transcriptional regulator [Rugosimonospora sp.]|nr:BldC family transcriptional regulator [Rugosimonospora sp.]